MEYSQIGGEREVLCDLHQSSAGSGCIEGKRVQRAPSLRAEGADKTFPFRSGDIGINETFLPFHGPGPDGQKFEAVESVAEVVAAVEDLLCFVVDLAAGLEDGEDGWLEGWDIVFLFS